MLDSLNSSKESHDSLKSHWSLWWSRNESFWSDNNINNGTIFTLEICMLRWFYFSSVKVASSLSKKCEKCTRCCLLEMNNYCTTCKLYHCCYDNWPDLWLFPVFLIAGSHINITLKLINRLNVANMSCKGHFKTVYYY